MCIHHTLTFYGIIHATKSVPKMQCTCSNSCCNTNLHTDIFKKALHFERCNVVIAVNFTCNMTSISRIYRKAAPPPIPDNGLYSSLILRELIWLKICIAQSWLFVCSMLASHGDAVCDHHGITESTCWHQGFWNFRILQLAVVFSVCRVGAHRQVRLQAASRSVLGLRRVFAACAAGFGKGSSINHQPA